MLLRQNLGRSHHRPLIAALHRHQKGGDRNDRLSGTHLALQQPVHRDGRLRGRS